MKRRFPVATPYKASESKEIGNSSNTGAINLDDENEHPVNIGTSLKLFHPSNPQSTFQQNPVHDQNFLFDKSIGSRIGQSRALKPKDTINLTKSHSRPDTVFSAKTPISKLPSRNFFDISEQP